jgi:hypothetical protein
VDINGNPSAGFSRPETIDIGPSRLDNVDFDLTAQLLEPRGDGIGDALLTRFGGAWSCLDGGDGWNLDKTTEPGCGMLG